MLNPGDIVDQRFEVLAIIGSGGLAEVYKVRHLELGSTYALKLLTWRRAKLAERMVLEGRIQAQLKHPNIVAVVDLVRHDGQVGLLMEFIDGDTLEGTLLAGPTPVDAALGLFSGVLGAVHAAHSAGVLHRDLKPANILMARNGSTIIPKVADFGLAKVVLDTAAGMTKAGMTMGTPGYLAPEQLADASTAGPKADIFALGVILHELLTGRRAYPLEDGHVAVHATANMPVASLRAVAPHVPYTVADAVARAVDRDPEARFESCAAFAQALYRDHPSLLQQFSSSLGGEQVSLSLSSPSKAGTSDPSAQTYAVEEAEPATSRGVWLWGLLTVAGLVFGVGLAATLYMLGASSQVAPPEPVPVSTPVGTQAPAPIAAPAAQDPDSDADTEQPAEPEEALGAAPVAPEPAVVAPPAPVPVQPVPEPDTEADTERDTEADTERDTEADTEPVPAPVIVVTEVEPEPAPQPVTYPQVEGEWSGTAGRQRMSLWLEDSSGGSVRGTMTLTLGPTVRTETVTGRASADRSVSFSAGELQFTGSASAGQMQGTYTSGGRGRQFDWNASR